MQEYSPAFFDKIETAFKGQTEIIIEQVKRFYDDGAAVNLERFIAWKRFKPDCLTFVIWRVKWKNSRDN